MTNQINIVQFAKLIGVSPSTVSRSLNGQGRISAGTREMVLTRMKELGYTPNLNAQRLVTGRSFTIALDPGGRGRLPLDVFSTELIGGIQDALSSHQYGLLLDAGRDSLRRWVRSGALDGVIALGGGPTDEEIGREIAAMGVPCIVIGHIPLPGICGVGSVAIDLEAGAREVARALVQNGHRRIGFLGSYQPNQVWNACRDELASLGVATDSALARFPGPSPEGGAQAMRELMSLRERPTAVFARTDALAAAALKTAWEMGLRAPQDVSIVGHDDLPFAAWSTPALTTVQVDCARIGRVAAEMFFTIQESPDEIPEPAVIPTRLIRRESLGRATSG
jgi:DNA-binding LacI/PurR family transcriptional regulator